MVNAAIELILERGIDGTTLAAIGERAGYSRGLATYRYGSKAGLFQEISQSIQRRWVGYLKRAVGTQSGIDALCSAADAYLEFVTDSPRDIRVLHILYYTGAEPSSGLQDLAQQAFRRQIADAERWISDGIADGGIRDNVNAASAATQYVAHIAGITYIWLLDPSGADFQQIHSNFKQSLRDQLSV